ncbi:MAG: rhodanese-like domain-containing protein [Acidobacteriota bacterium]
MKKLSVKLILFVLAAVAGLPLLAQSSKPANTTPPAPVVKDEVAEVPRITQQEFLKLFRDGGLTVVDVRDKAAYERGHIPGAIWMSQADFETRSKQLPANKPIVTYCS